jgi:hypothetical protein
MQRLKFPTATCSHWLWNHSDSARFRYLLSQTFGADPRSVQVLYYCGTRHSGAAWSLANIAGMKLRFRAANNRGVTRIWNILEKTAALRMKLSSVKGLLWDC